MAQGSGAAQQAAAASGTLGDFATAMDNTPGSGEDLRRWLRTSLLASLVALLLAFVLVRHAMRGAWALRALLVLAALGLAIPPLVLSAGSALLGAHLPPWLTPPPLAQAVLALAARLFPIACVLVVLALRPVRRGGEESAALIGLGPAQRLGHIVLRAAGPGLLVAFGVLLVLALRELEAVMLIDARVLPLRLYDKIHFSRLADEANLLFLCVLIQLVPAAFVGLLLLGRRTRGPSRPTGA